MFEPVSAGRAGDASCAGVGLDVCRVVKLDHEAAGFPERLDHVAAGAEGCQRLVRGDLAGRAGTGPGSSPADGGGGALGPGRDGD